MSNMMRIRIRRARELAGMDVAQAGIRLGLPAGQLSMIENGVFGLLGVVDTEPDPPTVGRMADLYGVSREWLRGQSIKLSDAENAVLLEIQNRRDRSRIREVLESLRRRDR